MGRNLPLHSPVECWAPRPHPPASRLRHPAPDFWTSLLQDVRKSGAGWRKRGGGGFGGRGVDSRARVITLTCSACSHPLPQPRPTPTKSCSDCPRPHPRGRAAASWELGGVGFMDEPFILWIEGPNCLENSWEGFRWFFAIERLFGSPRKGSPSRALVLYHWCLASWESSASLRETKTTPSTENSGIRWVRRRLIV